MINHGIHFTYTLNCQVHKIRFSGNLNSSRWPWTITPVFTQNLVFFLCSHLRLHTHLSFWIINESNGWHKCVELRGRNSISVLIESNGWVTFAVRLWPGSYPKISVEYDCLHPCIVHVVHAGIDRTQYCPSEHVVLFGTKHPQFCLVKSPLDNFYLDSWI